MHLFQVNVCMCVRAIPLWVNFDYGFWSFYVLNRWWSQLQHGMPLSISRYAKETCNDHLFMVTRLPHSASSTGGFAQFVRSIDVCVFAKITTLPTAKYTDKMHLFVIKKKNYTHGTFDSKHISNWNKWNQKWTFDTYTRHFPSTSIET